MTNQLIFTKTIIKSITDVNNNTNYFNHGGNPIFKIEFITNEIDTYTNNNISKHIKVIFNFNYANYQDAFEQIFLPYITIDKDNQYYVDDLIGKEFLTVFHLKYNELYDNTFYIIKSLISKEHAQLLVNEEEIGNNDDK